MKSESGSRSRQKHRIQPDPDPKPCYYLTELLSLLGTFIQHLSEFNVFRYFEIVRDVRQNKGSILRASVEYIKLLKADQVRYTKLMKEDHVGGHFKLVKADKVGYTKLLKEDQVKHITLLKADQVG